MAIRAMCKYFTLLTDGMLQDEELTVLVRTSSIEGGDVRVSIFPIVVCVRSAYVISTGIGFRVESDAVALLQLDL